jgi:hypothetical protein
MTTEQGRGGEAVDELLAYFGAVVERQKAEAAAAEVARLVAEREAIEQRAAEAWLSLVGPDQADVPRLVWTGYRAAGTSKADAAVVYLGRGLWLVDSQSQKGGDRFALFVPCSHGTYYEAPMQQGTAEWMRTYLRMADTARTDCVEHLPDGQLLKDAERKAAVRGHGMSARANEAGRCVVCDGVAGVCQVCRKPRHDADADHALSLLPCRECNGGSYPVQSAEQDEDEAGGPVHSYVGLGANRCGAQDSDTATMIRADVTCPACLELLVSVEV